MLAHTQFPSRDHQPQPSFYNNKNNKNNSSHLHQQQIQQQQVGANNYTTSTTLANIAAASHRFRPTAAAAAAAALAQIRPSDRTSSNLNSTASTDLMTSDSWMLPAHSQQVTRNTQHFGHNRDSSMSSIGSNTPASPYDVNMSNPQIAMTDPVADGLQDLAGVDTSSNYTYALAKPLNITDNFYASAIGPYANNGGVNGQGALTDLSVADGLPALTGAQQSQRTLAPASDLSATGSSTRSRPVSVASSIGGDSPATPPFHESEDGNRRSKNAFASGANMPKLDRTMTDIYSDELYNPHFNITSASPSPQTQLALSPSNELFAQRLQAANSQHLSAAQSPVSSMSRDRSPFRQDSPYASMMNDFPRAGGNAVRLESAQQIRERRKAEQDAKQVQEQLTRHSQSQRQPGSSPSTISPKDAVLEFNETDSDANFPLFPPQDLASYGMRVGTGSTSGSRGTSQQATPSFQSQPMTTPLQSTFNFSMPTEIQLPQQYPFVTRQPVQQSTSSGSSLSRMSSVEASSKPRPTQKPERTAADGGTYTCTYHGCSLRFETPALLQKHKREGHRQANTMNHLRSPVAMGLPSSAVANSQAGPHRCDRINPSTGKPCNTIFSRPYDLTRHEDTIHNARKQKVRCDICTEEKTFSRADALTRHYRVCHPDLDFPGKQRSGRRGA